MASATLASSLSTITCSNAFAGNSKPRALSRASPVRCSSQESDKKQEESVHRRALVAGVGVGLVSLVATGAARAIPPVPPGEPKPGSKEAKKKYAAICVSNATAAVCHG